MSNKKIICCCTSPYSHDNFFHSLMSIVQKLQDESFANAVICDCQMRASLNVIGSIML